ncbi:hypothetical protein SAMN05444521_4081 [Streptomyces sp. 3214.6]|nr:hypothetical protein [Streptomyces sp. 3214.6]SHI11470.1 hypothetical protein SAMN05444521_4081 [Streptomyces sp. 3214.6]
MAAVGLITGMAPGFAGRFAGFGVSLLVEALGAIGFVAGRFADGAGELGDLFSHPRARQPAATVRPAGPRRTTAD